MLQRWARSDKWDFVNASVPWKKLMKVDERSLILCTSSFEPQTQSDHQYDSSDGSDDNKEADHDFFQHRLFWGGWN